MQLKILPHEKGTGSARIACAQPRLLAGRCPFNVPRKDGHFHFMAQNIKKACTQGLRFNIYNFYYFMKSIFRLKAHLSFFLQGLAVKAQRWPAHLSRPHLLVWRRYCSPSRCSGAITATSAQGKANAILVVSSKWLRIHKCPRRFMETTL